MVFFPALMFYFFSQMFWYTHVFTLTDYITKRKWCIEKDKTPEDVFLLKDSNMDTTGIIESCSKWKRMELFFVSLLIISNKCHKLLSYLYCQLWGFLVTDSWRREWNVRNYSVSQVPAGNYMFKVNNRSTGTRCEICSKLTIKLNVFHTLF